LKKILNIVGARPNFMKVAPLQRVMQAHPGIEAKIVHTGQHYDERMSDVFFNQLELPKPDYYLGVGAVHIPNKRPVSCWLSKRWSSKKHLTWCWWWVM
jgi:UDP-N-acetylglucosamine 2-epimerase